MAFLADLERLLERVFERSSARVFRTRVQAVQVEHRVERAMERARVSEAGRISVPDRYRVRLTPADLAVAAGEVGGADALAGRLADAALSFARAHGYHLPARPTVSLVVDPSMTPGEIEVDAVVGTPPAVPPAGQPVPTGSGVASPRPADRPGPEPEPAPAGDGHPAGEPMTAGIRGDGTQTHVFRRPAPHAARAVLRAFAPDGTERTLEVVGTPLTIGRAGDNAVVLADGRVSRHHGRLQARHGALIYTDLGSTNGSRVNGVRVDEIALGAGDRLEVGDTVLVVETLPG